MNSWYLENFFFRAHVCNFQLFSQIMCLNFFPALLNVFILGGGGCLYSILTECFSHLHNNKASTWSSRQWLWWLPLFWLICVWMGWMIPKADVLPFDICWSGEVGTRHANSTKIKSPQFSSSSSSPTPEKKLHIQMIDQGQAMVIVHVVKGLDSLHFWLISDSIHSHSTAQYLDVCRPTGSEELRNQTDYIFLLPVNTFHNVYCCL